MAVSSKDPRMVALYALANMIRLLGAELVVGRHSDDIDEFERAVRAKLGKIQVQGYSAATIEAGLEEARALVERSLADVRAQWERKRGAAGPAEGTPPSTLH